MLSSISRNRGNRIVTFQVPIAGAGLADQSFFVSPDHFIVEKITACWTTAGAASSTLGIKKASGTTAPASGTELHSTAFALDGAANTVNTATLTATKANLRLKPNDRLCADFTGTVSALAGLNVTVYLAPVSKYQG
jgi:hypothetical protein